MRAPRRPRKAIRQGSLDAWPLDARPLGARTLGARDKGCGSGLERHRVGQDEDAGGVKTECLDQQRARALAEHDGRVAGAERAGETGAGARAQGADLIGEARAVQVDDHLQPGGAGERGEGELAHDTAVGGHVQMDQAGAATQGAATQGAAEPGAAEEARGAAREAQQAGPGAGPVAVEDDERRVEGEPVPGAADGAEVAADAALAVRAAGGHVENGGAHAKDGSGSGAGSGPGIGLGLRGAVTRS